MIVELRITLIIRNVAKVRPRTHTFTRNHVIAARLGKPRYCRIPAVSANYEIGFDYITLGVASGNTHANYATIFFDQFGYSRAQAQINTCLLSFRNEMHIE